MEDHSRFMPPWYSMHELHSLMNHCNEWNLLVLKGYVTILRAIAVREVGGIDLPLNRTFIYVIELC